MSDTTYSVLVVEDDVELSAALAETLTLAGYTCRQAGNGLEALEVLAAQTVDLIISDNHMPGMDGVNLLKHLHQKFSEIPVLMMTAYSSINGAVKAIQSGAVDYLEKPFESQLLLTKVGVILPRLNHLADEGVIAVDPFTKKTFALAKRLANSNATVMLLGESGTGKEVLANYIHANSTRHDKPFVAINCAAIPDTMLEATLFGYEKGAFTGAYQAKAGKFEAADGGTLLLDEISEMDISLQAKILRVLQERVVERVGGKEAIPFDVRIIATSNRRLEDEVAAGRFREDLYYRLNVFPVRWHPLRERPLDIVPLAQRFIKKYNLGQFPAVSLDVAAQQRLREHDWLGNVRELENVIQRALILKHGDTIVVEDLMLQGDEISIQSAAHLPEACNEPVREMNAGVLNKDLKQREYQLIVDTLKSVSGHRHKTAEILGISPRTLRYKMAKMRELGFNLDALSAAS